MIFISSLSEACLDSPVILLILVFCYLGEAFASHHHVGLDGLCWEPCGKGCGLFCSLCLFPDVLTLRSHMQDKLPLEVPLLGWGCYFTEGWMCEVIDGVFFSIREKWWKRVGEGGADGHRSGASTAWRWPELSLIHIQRNLYCSSVEPSKKEVSLGLGWGLKGCPRYPVHQKVQ